MIAIEFDSALLGETGSKEKDGQYTRLFRQRLLIDLKARIDLEVEPSESKNVRWLVPLENAPAFTSTLNTYAWDNNATKF
jgi:hypothetical protein